MEGASLPLRLCLLRPSSLPKSQMTIRGSLGISGLEATRMKESRSSAVEEGVRLLPYTTRVERAVDVACLRSPEDMISWA